MQAQLQLMRHDVAKECFAQMPLEYAWAMRRTRSGWTRCPRPPHCRLAVASRKTFKAMVESAAH